MLNRVPQRTSSDCTIAVLATVMGPPYTYEPVLRDSTRYNQFTRDGLFSAWWETYLRDSGFPNQYRSLSDLNRTVKDGKEVGIVMLAPTSTWQNGHIVAADELGFINPSTGWPQRIATLDELLNGCRGLGGYFVPEPDFLAVGLVSRPTGL